MVQFVYKNRFYSPKTYLGILDSLSFLDQSSYTIGRWAFGPTGLSSSLIISPASLYIHFLRIQGFSHWVVPRSVKPEKKKKGKKKKRNEKTKFPKEETRLHGTKKKTLEASSPRA